MTPILQDLDREWAATVSSPKGRRAVIRWINTTPDFAGSSNLNDVLESRRDPKRAEPVLRALAEMAADDEIAARTLLQAMLPGLVTLAGKTGNDDDEAIGELIAFGWERIRTYPCHRPGSIAGNILLDVRKRYRRHRNIDVPDSFEIPRSLVDRSESVEEVVHGKMQVDFIVEELRRAQRDGLMTAEILETILRTRLLGETLTEVAIDLRLETQMLCQRRWRAEVRLRDLPLAG